MELFEQFCSLLDDIFWKGYAKMLQREAPESFNLLFDDYTLNYK